MCWNNILDILRYIKYTQISLHFYFNMATRKPCHDLHLWPTLYFHWTVLALEPCYSHTESNVGTTWDLVKEADLWAPPQNCWTRICILARSPRNSINIQIWESLFKKTAIISLKSWQSQYSFVHPYTEILSQAVRHSSRQQWYIGIKLLTKQTHSLFLWSL